MLRNKWFKDPATRFAVLFLILFAGLYWFNLLYIGITAKGGLYFPFLDEHLNYIRWFRHILLFLSAKILSLLGYSSMTTDTVLSVPGHGGIILIYSCLGYGVMSFFTAFVLAWPKPFKDKWLFLVLGLILIQVLNIIRFVLLSLYWNKVSLGMDHHTLFNIVLYVILLGVMYWWIVRKDARIKKTVE
ncbi:hypothetical protein GS399_17705 [Pedobacter sp. HMF7647]|uniref:Exosortase/archaeosortase family protein n=1 Tax=Hufsiella arboris TaxID=2695275 RepID=A0A7K1YEK5_9SPHI|nr:archaeosortase/exosortase family protein [Hufsiella arboris]MXV52811.1 hypothetical protein [Hufsiella arboris]